MNRVILPTLLIILSFVAFFVWINPHYTNAMLLQAQLGQSNSALAQFAQLESVRSSLAETESGFSQTDLNKLRALLPDNVDNIRLFLNIQDIASHYNTSIADISVADQAKTTTGTQAIGPSNKQYGQMTLSFSITTSYENLNSFLKDLEKGLRLIEIKSIAFTADNKNPDTYKVTLGINAFWLNAIKSTTLTSSQ